MSQCVPSWDLDHPPNPSPKCPPSIAGTLESVVDQAKLLHPAAAGSPNANHLPVAGDALVPTLRRQQEDLASVIGSCDVGDSNRKRARVRDMPTATTRSIGSKRAVDETDDIGFATINSVTPFADDRNGANRSPDTENASFSGGGESWPTTVVDDHDSVCQGQRYMSPRDIVVEEDEKANERGNMRSTFSAKRCRAADIHNQSERKRRDRINEKMRTLQKLVPNSSKTDKASMLDEVIDYLKQLQAQVEVTSRMMSSMPAPMMMPMSMQQFQMTMIAQMALMGMGMGMGMGMMDMPSLRWAGPAGISPVMPASAATIVPMTAAAGFWDPSAGAPIRTVMPEPFSTFVPCPTQQPMTVDAHQRMAALYQQMFQPTNPK